jgi:hypothetical protein
MANSRRGGKRPGAGRKPKLSWDQRLNLGLEAEERLRKAAEARGDTLVDATNERLNLREKWARLHAVPAEQRQRRLRHDDAIKETVLDVRDNISDLYGRRKIDISTPGLRYGLRRQVIAALAKETSTTPRFVERCLEECRAAVSRVFKSDV